MASIQNTSDELLMQNINYLKFRDSTNNCDVFFQHISKGMNVSSRRNIDCETNLFHGNRYFKDGPKCRNFQSQKCINDFYLNQTECAGTSRLFNNVTQRK